MKLGVSFAWHVHSWEELLDLVRRAEELGYAAAFVDGDASMLQVRSRADVLEGWTVTVALLALTSRIEIGSMRLAHHWNAARLAQATATAARLAPGRLRFLISIGDRAIDARFGLPLHPVAERIARLDETLSAVRALWRGESVSLRGRQLELDGARLRPVPPGGRLPIAIAARRPRMLDLVAAHADVWEINLPPIPPRVERATAQLTTACRRRGRDPAEIRRQMWIFTRLAKRADRDGALREFRRLHPWFRELPDAELAEALVVGSREQCLRRIEEIASKLHIDLPVLDLSGLDAPRSRRLLEALAPSNNRVDAGT